mmetsp:Transcript_104714/g.265877  ORF Transcript_104714/g.265877 Transcript_104714/m.265877 type:complete len:561 (-) Transcript_104714:69-1751(-)
MGKNQHSKDGLHLRPTEWAEDGRGFKDRKRSPYAKLPLTCCSISLQPFDNPVGTVDGAVFEATNITRYIKRFGVNPVTGAKLEIKELIPLHFHKNGEGQLHCPVTFKVFTNHSHVVVNTASGHIYSFDAVDQLNRKTKNWKDLITSESFKWADVVTIQDPDDSESREVSKFYFMQKGQQDEVIAEITHRESKILAEQKRDTLRKNAAIDRIFEEKRRIAEEKEKEEGEKAEGRKAEEEAEKLSLEAEAVKALAPVKRTNDNYTSGAMAESFTSTTRSLITQNELRLQTEDEALQELYETVRKKKAKGYVRIITSEGMLNLEIHCDMAPRTSDNFLRLCERDYYQGTIFHRLIHNFVMQGGDPTGTGKGGKSGFEGGTAFKDEFDARLTHQGPGIISMANNGKNTNKSQFFVSLKSCQHLDNKHSVFGRVVGGIQLLDVFNKWETDEKDKPVKQIKLISTEVFKNPFREAIAEAGKPKVEKEVDPVATWFSNRRDPMQEHRNRNSGEIGKYLEDGMGGRMLAIPGKTATGEKQDLPDEEMEYAGVARKSKKARTTIDASVF